MQRITISLDEALAGMLDDYVAASGYQSRSEGVRDAVERWRGERRDSPESVAVLSHIYDRGTRSLARRTAIEDAAC